MFHSASRFGLDTVVLLLFICQRMITMPLFTNYGVHATFSYNIFLCLIASVQIQVLSFVRILNERIDNLGIMDTCICCIVCLYEF